MNRDGGGGGGGDSFLAKVGLGALTCSSLLAVCRSCGAGDLWSVAFVVAAYAALLLLFRSLRGFERAVAPEERRRAKASVWVFSTMLAAMFAARVAPLMPTTLVAAAVWLMAATTAVAGFWALFVYP